MKNYRLKPEAVPFFNSAIATSVKSYEEWMNMKVDIVALEEVKPAFITFGHSDLKGRNSSSLSGWNSEEGKHFYFTINFPSVKLQESDKFGNGKVIRDLMNRIQYQIDNFYQDYLEDQNSES